MAVGMSLRWVFMGLLVGTALVPVESQLTSCTWLTVSDSSCIEYIDCQDGGTSVQIWEDCIEGSELFRITNASIRLDDTCEYAEGVEDVIKLITKLNAEDDINSRTCDVSLGPPLFFIPVDINEFPPFPAGDTLPVMDVNIMELTEAPHDIATIYYTDDDIGETESLMNQLISSEYEEIFTLANGTFDAAANTKSFIFRTLKELDYEDRPFYKVEYQIISKDKKGNITTTTHTFFVYVGDAPDNEPIWTEIEPLYELDECLVEDNLFQVKAQDRDVMVDYSIKYSLTEESDYFEVDETTGWVKRKKPIDREELLEKGISSFTLTIVATEYKETGDFGEEPNSNQQVSIITILDCNDETPEFNNNTYELEMDEVTSSGDQVLDLTIVVKDMDEGDGGTFTLKTDQPDHVLITPTEGKQTQEVTLTALYKNNGSIFDYEEQEDTPFTITITATEKENTNHTNTATVTITLRDVNDERPFFFKKTFSADVEESTKLNTTLLRVEAGDYDVSTEFGEKSIRYSLESSCSEFDIDRETGNVTLATVLDFEDKSNHDDNVITCSVTARDGYGTGVNTDTATIKITIIDVVDEPPRVVKPVEPMEILENSQKDTEVGPFSVTDADAEASITLEIQDTECTDGIPAAEVTGWFKITSGSADPPNFPAHVVVGDAAIDREVCKEVTLTILATDENTLEEYESESSDTETFIITILDENDELPTVECESSCEDISIDEDDELDPSDVSIPVFSLRVSDPDEKDTIYLSLGEGEDLMYLSKNTVNLTEGKVETVEVWTKETAVIDRETQDSIDIEIIFSDSQSHSDTKTVSVKVNDLNDKVPKINPASCVSISIDEDDGSGSKNGTSIAMITATDEDEESPHNELRYLMLNDQIPDSKNRWAPFRIDEKTGNVTILLIEGEKALDREQYANWELIFRAYDACDPLTSCKVLSSQECIVNITVMDVNDNAPYDLTWQPEGIIEVNDFLKKDTDLGYELSALDDDEGINALLTYEVLGTYPINNNNINMDLFRAEDEPFNKSSCRLYANEDFEGKNYTGEYIVTVKATDGGMQSTEFNISINVKDANDEVPYFVFQGCSGENVITMEENEYTPGEEEYMEVRCDDPTGDRFIIETKDADLLFENQKVQVTIDYENSTVKNLGDGVNEQILLSYWDLHPPECEPECYLRISHLINREEGSAYNLSLRVRNTAEPVKESWANVLVIVTNRMEFDPYFCKTGDCSQVLYMKENEPDATATFDKAIDEDNNGTTAGDEEYDKVYYYIVDGDKEYFQTISDTSETLVLKNLPDGLDREKTDTYSLKILVTNTDGGGNLDIGDSPRNDTLNLTIRVLDENDEVPSFDDDVIFTSFMETDGKGDRISIIEAIDRDLNETLTYEIQDDLQWFEADLNPENPFILERNDSRSVYLTMNFDPKGLTNGYCNFTISVEDLLNHRAETVVKVYVINEDYQVPMYFSNQLDEVTTKSSEIEKIYTSVYGYRCSIDSILPDLSRTRETVSDKTTVYMHFIDEEKNVPVLEKTILDLSENAELMMQLISRLDLIGINLDSVGTKPSTNDEKNPEEKIRELQILLGVVGLVLGLLLLLLGTIYWIRTTKLQRKIKVLSTDTYGSKEDGLNKMGLDMDAVPGSNYLAKEHGNHNPVFNESGGLDLKTQDTESISSGDSVLVGVEDNPEFKGYMAKSTPGFNSTGFDNSSSGRSIDDVSAAPPGVQGGMKGNPLLNLGALTEEPRPSTSSEQSDYAGASVGSHGDTDAADKNMNSNFSLY